MKTDTLNMLLRLKEWEEELEKQKFTTLLSERTRIEQFIKEIEETLKAEKFFVADQKDSQMVLSSENLFWLYTAIQYLIEQLIQTNEILKQINEEVEKQRISYEEAYKERKKIEQLYERLINAIRQQRIKMEEKLSSELFILSSAGRQR